MHFFIQRCRLHCQKLMSPDNTLLFLLVFLEQFTSPGGCTDLQFKKPWLKSPTCSTAEASKYCCDEEQVNNCMGKAQQPLLTKWHGFYYAFKNWLSLVQAFASVVSACCHFKSHFGTGTVVHWVFSIDNCKWKKRGEKATEAGSTLFLPSPFISVHISLKLLSTKLSTWDIPGHQRV